MMDQSLESFHRCISGNSVLNHHYPPSMQIGIVKRNLFLLYLFLLLLSFLLSLLILLFSVILSIFAIIFYIFFAIIVIAVLIFSFTYAIFK